MTNCIFSLRSRRKKERARERETRSPRVSPLARPFAGAHYFQAPVTPQVAQAHHRNADVTLARERCCVTNDYLQRLVWDAGMGCKRFFSKERKNVIVFKYNRLTLLHCSTLCCFPASQAVLKRFRRVSAMLMFHC